MDNFIGEIRAFSFGIIPQGWLLCDGSLVAIQQYQALYALIRTTYGGNGTTNFALPDLRGRAAVCLSKREPIYEIGYTAGQESVTLTASNIPAHTHAMEVANNPGNKGMPTNRIAIPTSADKTITASFYSTNAAQSALLAGATLDAAGGGMPHNNMQPFLTVNYCIATSGLWPPRDY